MAGHEEDTLVIIKPDAFWRHLEGAVEERVNALGLNTVAEFILADGENLSEEGWKEFYFPAIGDKPERLDGTSKYMAHGPVKVMHLRGQDAIRKVRASWARRDRGWRNAGASAAISGPAPWKPMPSTGRNSSNPAMIPLCSI